MQEGREGGEEGRACVRAFRWARPAFAALLLLLLRGYAESGAVAQGGDVRGSRGVGVGLDEGGQGRERGMRMGKKGR